MLQKDGFTVRNLLLCSLICVLVYGLILILQWYVAAVLKNRRIFKMLSHYKRPPYLPILGHALRFIGSPAKVHNAFIDMAFNYGPNFMVWMLDRVIVVIGKPEDLERVMMSQSCLEKNEFYHFMRPVIGDGSIAAPVAKWRRTRKLMNPTFNTKVLEGYQPIFARCATTFVDEILPKYLGKREVDWFSLFLIFDMDVLMQTSMGIDYDVQRKPNEFPNWLKECTRTVFLRMAQIIYHPDFIFTRSNLGKAQVENKLKFWEFTERIIRDKRQKFRENLENNTHHSFLDEAEDSKISISKKAFLDCLLDWDHRGLKFTDEDLRNELIVMFIAGTDTTSSALTFFLTMMGMHPEIQDKVYEEVMSVLGSDSSPAVQDLSKLEYLERCIKETLRLFPPGPLMFRKNIGDDLKISDGVIPRGAAISICPLYTQRSELYWKDPLKFDPDRFLPEEAAKRHPYSFIPFSGGPRGCVGQKFAYNNMKTVLSILIKKYRIHCDGYKSIEEIKLESTIVMVPIEGFKFWLERR